jgi:transcriptional regulator NrdR family protein
MTRTRQATACPTCGDRQGGNVADTRPEPDGSFTRLRTCRNDHCGKSFITSERAVSELGVLSKGYLPQNRHVKMLRSKS